MYSSGGNIEMSDLQDRINAGKWAMVEGRDVPSVLASRVATYGDKPFMVWEPFEGSLATYSYAQFGAAVESLAGALHSRGVQIGDRVLVHLDNSPEFVISWFACARLGAVAVSTNTRSVARDMEYFAEHAGVVGAITSPGFAEEKEFYTEETVVEKFKMSPTNFILYKTLMGDNSDKVAGVKGLGPKKLYKLFPELSERDMTLDDIYNICESKFKENVIYARIIQGIDALERNYKIMDLSNPMIDKNDENYLNEVVKSKDIHYIPDQFIAMYNDDKLGGMIRNLDFWIKDIFEPLQIK